MKNPGGPGPDACLPQIFSSMRIGLQAAALLHLAGWWFRSSELGCRWDTVRNGLGPRGWGNSVESYCNVRSGKARAILPPIGALDVDCRPGFLHRKLHDAFHKDARRRRIFLQGVEVVLLDRYPIPVRRPGAKPTRVHDAVDSISTAQYALATALFPTAYYFGR